VSVTNGHVTVVPRPATKYFNTAVGGNPNETRNVNLPTPIDASLITLTGMQGSGAIYLYSGDVRILSYETNRGDLVLPLTQTLTVDRFTVFCFQTACNLDVNVVGR
jgi:hypothetical protein